MARATIPQNNYLNQQIRVVQGLGLRVEDLATVDPSSMNDSDRQAVTDVIRHALERLTRHDALASALGGLSPGASTLLRRLKGIPVGTVEFPDVWRQPFASEEDAQAAAQELSNKGLIAITQPPGGIPGTSAVGLTPRGQAALEGV